MRWALAFICLPLLGFQYNPPGRLQAGNEGRVDARDYAPGMRFPLERAPAYANSQVYMPGSEVWILIMFVGLVVLQVVERMVVPVPWFDHHTPVPL